MAKFTRKKGKQMKPAAKHSVKGRFMRVNAEKDIPSFEKLLKKGPVTIVMVYLDWCGHCQKAKPGFMEVAKKTYPGVNFALLNGDIQDKTSLKSVKVEGVPEFVVNVAQNGVTTASKVPISYEKESIARLANASSASVNTMMNKFPATMAISNKNAAEVLAEIKKNKNNSMMNEEALPVPNVIDESADMLNAVGEANLGEANVGEANLGEANVGEANTQLPAPTVINPMTPMGVTSPIATFMNMSKNMQDASRMQGGSRMSYIQPRQDQINRTQFLVELPTRNKKSKTRKVRGKYSTVAKAIREYYTTKK